MSLGQNIKKAIDFLTRDIWMVPLDQYSSWKSFLIRQVKILIFTAKSFSEDRVQIRASALTYYSMLAMVPFLIVALGIANSFGYKEYLLGQLTTAFAGREQVLETILNFAENFLANTSSGWFAAIGMIALIWTVVGIFISIEDSFNDIWQVNKSRHFARRLGDYIAMLFIIPLLLIVMGGTTVFFTSRVSNLFSESSWMSYLTPFVSFLFKILPYLLT